MDNIYIYFVQHDLYQVWHNLLQLCQGPTTKLICKTTNMHNLPTGKSYQRSYIKFKCGWLVNSNKLSDCLNFQKCLLDCMFPADWVEWCIALHIVYALHNVNILAQSLNKKCVRGVPLKCQIHLLAKCLFAQVGNVTPLSGWRQHHRFVMYPNFHCLYIFTLLAFM